MAILSKHTTIGGKKPLTTDVLYDEVVANVHVDLTGDIDLNNIIDNGDYTINDVTSIANFPDVFTIENINSLGVNLRVLSATADKKIQILINEMFNYVRYKTDAINWTEWTNESNDFGENTNIISNASYALGINTYAGSKAFKIIEPFNNNGTGIISVKLNNINGLESGMNCTIRASKEVCDNLIITTVDKKENSIFISGVPANIKYETDLDNENTHTYENYITIHGRPELGDIDIGHTAYSCGYNTYAQGRESFAGGRDTKVVGQYGAVFGRQNIVGHASFATGRHNKATGNMSHAEGIYCNALGPNSHAEGNTTNSLGDSSHSEGCGTNAIGDSSHSEGLNTTSSGARSHAEGNNTTASGHDSHSEGNNTTASGYESHSEGFGTSASGSASHSEGFGTNASGNNSHAEGKYTIASSDEQHVQGRYNIEDKEGNYASIVGNGYVRDKVVIPSNAYTLDWKGNAWFAGDVTNAAGKGLSSNDFTNEDKLKLFDGVFGERYFQQEDGTVVDVLDEIKTAGVYKLINSHVHTTGTSFVYQILIVDYTSTDITGLNHTVTQTLISGDKIIVRTGNTVMQPGTLNTTFVWDEFKEYDIISMATDLNNVMTNKQDTVSDELQTTSKTIIGAINELAQKIADLEK